MTHSRFLLTALMGLAGCGGTGGQNGANTPASSEVHGAAPQTTGVLAGPPLVLAGCYQMAQGGDTARLNLQVRDTMVSGRLQYNWRERDSNVGTIRGVLRDSLILADYTFQSEGLTSVRQVAFKIVDTTLVEAYGELAEKEGRVFFRNPAALQYRTGQPFVKVPCPR